MRIVIFGPPGAGKGTQAKNIKQEFGIPHLSTGAIFREAIENETELGRKVKDILDSGELVSDDLVTALVEEEIDKPAYDDGYILDGYPRTLGQAEAYDQMLDQKDATLDACILLEVPEQELIDRILSRGEGRSDDTKEKVKKRLKVYREETAPVREYYQKQGVVEEIDGTGTVEEIFERIKSALKTES